MPAPTEPSVFAGFRRVLRQGTLVFAVIFVALAAMVGYQYQRSAEAVRSVDHTRAVIAYIDALRTYLLNLDNAVRKYAESQDAAHLDLSLICPAAPCPSAERLLERVAGDPDQVARLTPLPALEAALETGFGALQERAESGATPMEPDLAGFDKSAMEQIHRILIDAGRAELRRAPAPSLRQRSTKGAMRSTMRATPSALGWSPSAWLSAGSCATPSRKKG